MSSCRLPDLTISDHAVWDCADNDDGISILDVTEPDRPAYCFLRSEGILNAYGYLNAYYPVGQYKASLPAGSGNEGPRNNKDVDEKDTESDSDDESGEYFFSGTRGDI